MGDDDILFNMDNLVWVLSKYDLFEMWYIGSNLESYRQNDYFSYSMVYGGGGFVISYFLVEVLIVMQDECLEWYFFLFGSDDCLYVCIIEFGVFLMREGGFYQVRCVGCSIQSFGGLLYLVIVVCRSRVLGSCFVFFRVCWLVMQDW